MSTSGSSSSSLRKDFDVKQILRSRWRWFGHPAVPAHHNPPLGDFFTGREAGASPGENQSPSVSVCSTSNGTGNGTRTGNDCIVAVGTSGNGSCSGNSSCNANNRTFTDNYAGSPTDHLPVTAFAATAAGHSSCPRSFSQPEWVTRLSVSHSRPVTDTERPGDGSSLLQPAVPEASVPVAEEETGLTGTERNNNRDDTASSSCSSATLSSCVSMEPCVSPDECVYTAHAHADLTFSRMETYLRTKQLCDVTLVAGDRRIPAHRLVLSSVSDYFAAMFTSDVREAKQEEVKMEGVDPDALWVLVQYAYTGRVELREDTIECILSVSCLLQLQSVVQACCNFLIKQLHPSNCLGIRSYADTQSCTHLHHAAHSYTMEKFVEVVKGQEFLLLPLEEMDRLLSSDDMNVPDEETVVTALLSWVRHDVSTRQPHLPSLLAHIRLPLLQTQFLADLECSPLLRDSVESQRLLMEGRTHRPCPKSVFPTAEGRTHRPCPKSVFPTAEGRSHRPCPKSVFPTAEGRSHRPCPKSVFPTAEGRSHRPCPKSVFPTAEGRSHRPCLKSVFPTAEGRTHRPCPKSVFPTAEGRTHRPCPKSVLPTAEDRTHRPCPKSVFPTAEGRTHRPCPKSVFPTAEGRTHRPCPKSVFPTAEGRTHRPCPKSVFPTAEGRTHRPCPKSVFPTAKGRTHRPCPKSVCPIAQARSY
ncbi:kelch-like protein 1 [Oncorhynchus masou masou]|uniref:kelch-like protein 1 n=1 Tax=Oncorhynchus masou masou TaxID=90313 RepID=UPI00318434C0